MGNFSYQASLASLTAHDPQGSRQFQARFADEDEWSESTDNSEVIISKRTVRPGAESRAPRVEIRLVVNIESESNFYAGFTENMSECGVFVATFAPLRKGSRVDLCISLPHREPIRVSGTVRWLRPYSERNATPPGMGVRFDQLSAADTARIQEFTKARTPMLFDDETSDVPQIPTLRP